MEKYVWFYVGLMLVLIIGNALQVNRMKRRGWINWFQIVIASSAIVWFSILSFKVFTSLFFAVTSFMFLTLALLEVGQFFAKAEKSFWDYVFLIFSGFPVIFSILILTGII